MHTMIVNYTLVILWIIIIIFDGFFVNQSHLPPPPL